MTKLFFPMRLSSLEGPFAKVWLEKGFALIGNQLANSQSQKSTVNKVLCKRGWKLFLSHTWKWKRNLLFKNLFKKQINKLTLFNIKYSLKSFKNNISFQWLKKSWSQSEMWKHANTEFFIEKKKKEKEPIFFTSAAKRTKAKTFSFFHFQFFQFSGVSDLFEMIGWNQTWNLTLNSWEINQISNFKFLVIGLVSYFEN